VKPVRKRIARRAIASGSIPKKASTNAFSEIFSHAGALSVAKIANTEIKAAKVRLRKLGIDSEDPSSEDDPESILD